ncbi:MAG: phosphotransferase [Candidatus Dormibacteraeota bacterium]|nr:phosphotransferase [Candidatus Dormibacteraeota bacterium]
MARHLEGGNFDTEVIQVGDTVRRTTGEWTPAVHALLAHLDQAGFDGAPRALGVDEAGREVLSFLEGEVGRIPLPGFMRSDATLAAVARMLRRLHDATITFASPVGARWRQAATDPGPVEVVCHNDWGPHNAIFRSERLVGFIDWDFARPGSRLWDIAWAALTWVPVRTDEHCQAEGWMDPPDRGRRFRLFCDAYGLLDRGGVLDAVRSRAIATGGWIEAGAAAGEEVFRRLAVEGHANSYRQDGEWIEANRDWLTRALWSTA